MPLSRTQRLRRTDAPVEALQIGPEEYFVLTRVEGRPTYGEIVGGSGLPPEETERIVERLVELGALAVVEAADGSADGRPDPMPRPTPLGSRLRKRADTRRRELLQRQLDPTTELRARATTVRLDPPAEPPPPPEPEPEPELATPRRGVIEPVAADDPRLDPACAVPLHDQRRLLALDDRGDDVTPFQALSLEPTDDEREIKRAYFDASRVLHPDAYFGKELGAFRPILARLFSRAKQAYAELRKAEIRRPYVAEVEAEARRREAEQAARQEAARKKAEDEQRAAADLRRRRVEGRRRERAVLEKHRLEAKLESQVHEHLQEAAKAQEVGNLARAANFLRLALQADPRNDEIRVKWEETRALARKERAKVAYTRALQFAEYGQMNEATPLFTEAADADPTSEHLAHAADAVRSADPMRARGYALKALEALNVETASKASSLDPAAVARLRMMIGRAFAAAGQTKTALEQAQLAEAALPGDLEVRSLLKSLKVK